MRKKLERNEKEMKLERKKMRKKENYKEMKL